MEHLREPLKLSTVYGITEEAVGPETRFLSERVGSLYRWWAAAGGGVPPPRSRFDVADHRDLVANIFLVQVLPDGEFLLKIHGEKVIDLFGINNSGRVVSRHEGVGAYGHALSEYYRTIVRDRVCKRCTGDLEHRDRAHVRFESIDCPLADDAGSVVAIIGVIDQIK